MGRKIARREMRGEECRRVQLHVGWLMLAACVEFERGDADLAREIAARVHEKPGLRADKGDGARRADGNTAADDIAGVAIEAARHIEREDASIRGGRACRRRHGPGDMERLWQRLRRAI